MALTSQVFVSHTSDMELFPAGRSFVQAVLDGIGRAGLAAVAMRHFAAREGVPVEYCRQRVRECEFYVAVIGFRYGSLVPGTELSYTEAEFQEAGAAGKLRLVFLLHQDARVPEGSADADRSTVDRFRARLDQAGLIRATFTTAADLELEVLHALTEAAGALPLTAPGPGIRGTARGGAGVRGGSQAPLAWEPVRAWGNVPARNPAFAGREEQLAWIRRALAGEGGRAAVQALHGMGGVGKTQLAIEYAHRYAGDYDVIWWLDSENTALMTQQYADLAEHLGAARKGLPVDAVRRALLSDLHRRPRWLLVFDNAEDPAFLRDWLPSGPGHVIITSRAQDWAELAAPVPVDVLPRHESVELLRARVPGITMADAEALAGALGDLPLALAQAAAFLAGTRMPAAGYTQLLKDRAAALLGKGKPLTYRDTLSAATALACDRLRAADEDAAALAEICAFLAPEPVPVGWLVTAAGMLPGGLPARLPDPLERDDLVAALTRTSLARLNDDGLTMHRLTQAILRTRSTEPGKVRAHAEAVLTANTPESTLAPGTWPTWGRLLPHLLALAPERSDNPGLQTATVQAAGYLLDSGKVSDALSFATRIHGLWRDRLGPDDRQTLTIANMLVSAHRVSGHLDQARQLGEDILGSSRRLYGDDDPDTLDIAIHLALVLHALGDYHAARELSEHALRHLRQIRGDDHPMTLASAINLAEDLHALGDYHAARELNEDTLQRCRRTLGDNNLVTLVCAANLASDLRELGDPHAARALHQDVFQRSRRALGKDHPVSLGIAGDLAADLRVLGHYRAARALIEDTLRRSRRVLGDDHPGTLRLAEHLAEELRTLRETATSSRKTGR
jgi:tetratricopeptide (TPR) repeat protein